MWTCLCIIRLNDLVSPFQNVHVTVAMQLEQFGTLFSEICLKSAIQLVGNIQCCHVSSHCSVAVHFHCIASVVLFFLKTTTTKKTKQKTGCSRLLWIVKSIKEVSWRGCTRNTLSKRETHYFRDPHSIVKSSPRGEGHNK